MEFRLATIYDLTDTNCRSIFEQSIDYCRTVPQDVTKSWDIFNHFINFSNGRQQDPQFWIALDNGKIKGFMLTQAIILDNKSCCYIRQAYISPNFRGNGLSDFAIEQLQKKAKNAGYQKLICQRYGQADVFGRLMNKLGFKYKATEFEREI